MSNMEWVIDYIFQKLAQHAFYLNFCWPLSFCWHHFAGGYHCSWEPLSTSVIYSSRKRTKTNVSLKWLYVEPIPSYISQKQRGMFIYMETLAIICLMLSSLLLPNTVKCQHHFSNLWFNGQFSLRFFNPDCWRAAGHRMQVCCEVTAC